MYGQNVEILFAYFTLRIYKLKIWLIKLRLGFTIDFTDYILQSLDLYDAVVVVVNWQDLIISLNNL